MTEEQEIEELKIMIDKIQSKLTELFEEFHELRVRVSRILPMDDTSSIPSATIFSRIEKETSRLSVETHSDVESEETKSEPIDHVPPLSIEMTSPDETVPEILTLATVSRHLDPIVHEIKTGESPAEVLAEYLQAAKTSLITKDRPNVKVSRDMDIVLKFLRARGSRGIRDEERSNILRRIERWRAYLISD